MEKIKQALERARQQQSGVYAVPAAPAGPAQELGTPGVEFVEYRQTRVVNLDPEHLRKHRIIAFNKHDPLTGTIDVLRTKILRKMEDHGWRTLAITSPTPGAGKTVLAINLAMSIAYQTDKTAMLVDFDLRTPSVGAYLGIPDGKSLNEVLNGEAELHEALVNPGLPRLVILPTAKAVEKSSEILSSRKVAGLIHELRARYAERVVIFDLPPMLKVDDAIGILPQIDCVLMVVGNGMSTQTEVEDCMRNLSSANLLGVVLNKAEEAGEA